VGNTSIQWTDKVWNPARGCSRVSPGCVNCYAERQALRFTGKTITIGLPPKPGFGPFGGFVTKVNGHASWTGKVELIESTLDAPLRWKKPARIFVNSMSDLFHEALPDEAIDRVFAVMALSPQHTFQVLTKRAGRMQQYFSRGQQVLMNRWGFWASHAIHMRDGGDAGRASQIAAFNEPRWPLSNVWLGISAEDQQRADERIPLLVDTPAAVRFVSYEPALAAVDFTNIKVDGSRTASGFAGRFSINFKRSDMSDRPIINWVIVGGESGPGARPFNVAWAESTIMQCKAAGVACFVKQLGANPFLEREAAGAFVPDYEYSFADKKGGDWDEWSSDLRVREYPRCAPETGEACSPNTPRDANASGSGDR
jgi:protein gp37